MPRTFSDSAGRQWTVTVNVAAAKRIRDMAKANILALTEGSPPLLDRMVDDGLLMADILWATCQPDGAKIGVKPDQFFAALNGQALADGAAALWQELVDFFRPGRPGLAHVLEAIASPEPASPEPASPEPPASGEPPATPPTPGETYTSLPG